MSMPSPAFVGCFKFLSNMLPCKLSVNGLSFNSSEAAFQSFKYSDPNKRGIFSMMDGYEAKRYWKSRGQFVREDWNDIRFTVLKLVVRQKFIQNPVLLQKLLNTDDAFLVELNTWHDNTYGNCTCPKCSHIVGQDRFGAILREVKSELSRPF